MQHKQHYSKSILNETVFLPQNLQNHESYQQSYARKLFKSMFCISVGCKSTSDMILPEPSSTQIQSSLEHPKKKSSTNQICQIEEAINTDTLSNYYLVSNGDYQTLPALMAVRRYPLTTVCTETALDKVCQYLQSKLSNQHVLLCQQELCSKLVKALSTGCSNLLVSLENAASGNTTNTEMVLQPKFRDVSVFDTVLIAPYLKCSCYTPEIQHSLLREYLQFQLKSATRSNSVMLLIPSSFPFSELSEMLASENNAFFAMNENPAWFSRVRNIHEYTYLMQRDCARSNSNLSKSRLKPSKVSVTSAGREFVFRCSTFSRLVRVKGVCIDNQLEYYLVKLVMPWKPEKSTKWIAEQMFFFNEFSRLTNIQHYFDWLTKLVKQASFVSCLQCINCIRQDQITLNGLSSQMAHLRYLTVLISSGVVDNEKELAMLQQIFLEVAKLPILDIQIKDGLQQLSIQSLDSQHNNNNNNNNNINITKHTSSDFQGYSYDLSNEDKISFVDHALNQSGAQGGGGDFFMTEFQDGNHQKNRRRIQTDLEIGSIKSEHPIHYSLHSSENQSLK